MGPNVGSSAMAKRNLNIQKKKAGNDSFAMASGDRALLPKQKAKHRKESPTHRLKQHRLDRKEVYSQSKEWKM